MHHKAAYLCNYFLRLSQKHTRRMSSTPSVDMAGAAAGVNTLAATSFSSTTANQSARIGSFEGVDTPACTVPTRLGHLLHVTPGKKCRGVSARFRQHAHALPGVLSTLPGPFIAALRMHHVTKLVDDAWSRGLPANEYFRLGCGTATILTQREPGVAVVRSQACLTAPNASHTDDGVRSQKTTKSAL